MRELRVQHRGNPLRILYAFDPRRVAILLLGVWLKERADRKANEAALQADRQTVNGEQS